MQYRDLKLHDVQMNLCIVDRYVKSIEEKDDYVHDASMHKDRDLTSS